MKIQKGKKKKGGEEGEGEAVAHLHRAGLGSRCGEGDFHPALPSLGCSPGLLELLEGLPLPSEGSGPVPSCGASRS